MFVIEAPQHTQNIKEKALQHTLHSSTPSKSWVLHHILYIYCLLRSFNESLFYECMMYDISPNKGFY